MCNEMSLIFDAISTNEGFARMAVAAFITYLNPTIEEIADVKTAVSEAVTNCIIHGYENRGGKIYIHAVIENGVLALEIKDKGVGIEDVEKAMEPLYTSKPQLERSGMGFSFMEAFMDELEVESTPAKGTCVKMKKKLALGDWIVMED